MNKLEKNNKITIGIMVMKKYGFLIALFIQFFYISAGESPSIDLLYLTPFTSSGSDNSDSSSESGDSDDSTFSQDPDYAAIVSESFNGCQYKLQNVEQRQGDILERFQDLERANGQREKNDARVEQQICRLTDCILGLDERVTQGLKGAMISHLKPAQRVPKNLLPLQELQNLIIVLGASSLVAIYWHLLLNSFSDNHGYVVD